MNRTPEPEYYPDITGSRKWGNLRIGWRIFLGFVDDFGNLIVW